MSVEKIENLIDRYRCDMAFHDWEGVRTFASAIVGLKVVRNLKLGKAPFDGFRKR